MRTSRPLPLLAVVFTLLSIPVSRAQVSSIAPRIVAPVDESSLTTLHGNVPMRAKAEFDKGEVAPSTQLTHVRLVLSRSAAQQVALDQYLAELQNQSSPNYHKWLTPDQFGKLYGPADSDIAAIVAWIQSSGLTLEAVSPGRTNIAFAGTAAQVAAAFHTSIHSFERNGESFLSNVSNPRIPSALAAVISGVAHLNTIKPKAQHQVGELGKYDAELGRMVSVQPSVARRPTPQFTTGSAGSYTLYLVPGDAATIYDTPNKTLNANYSSGTTYDGTGITIGIGGDATILPATVADYRTRFLGNSTQPIITNVDKNKQTTDTDEAYIDTELAGGLAPGATIHFYTSSDLISAIEKALSDNTVDIFSLSFGECELDLTTAGNKQVKGWWEQAAAQGIAVTVSSGDNGSAACDNNSTEFVAQYGLQVSGFASTPYNIAVGGTDLDGLIGGFTTHVSTTESTSATLYRSALSYIPESTWNDSPTTDGLLAANVPLVDADGNTNIVAGSGGFSSCSTNTDATKTGVCTSGYAKPTWQRGTGVPNDMVRDLPDISLMAGNGYDSAAWLICTDDAGTNTGGATVTTNCTNQSDGHFYFYGYGGTSTAAPAFAGILALLEQKTGSRLGQAAKGLYDLYNGSHSSAVFHDTTVGNNSVICTATTPNCLKNTAGNYYLKGYDTTAGYDLATGMGSVDAANLINYWGSAVGVATSTVTVVPSATSITAAQTLSVAVTVAGSGGLGTPTGTVTLTGGGYSSSTETLAAGTYTFAIPAGALAAGTDTFTATYSGDVNYATSTGSASVTVIAGSFTLSATNVTLTAGATTGNVSTVTVTPSNGYTGTVTLTAAVTSSPTGVVGTPTLTGSSVIISSASPGTGTITVGTLASTGVRASRSNPAKWFKAAGGAAIAALLFFFIPVGSRRWRQMLTALLMVVAVSFAAVGCGGSSGSGGSGGSTTTPTKTTPIITVTPAMTSIAATDPLSVAVTVAGTGTSAPTGTVTLTSGTYTASAVTLSSGAATFAIPAGSLTTGATDTLTVSYSGDTNYNTASGTATVAVASPITTAGAYTVTVTGKGNDVNSTTATTTFTLTIN